MYRVHGTTGDDPTEPWRSTPFPYPALEHEPYIGHLAARLREQGVNPSPNAMGVDRRVGGTCIRCETCGGFPCKLDAKSDAQTCGIDPAVATGQARLLTGMRVRRIVTDGTGRRVDHVVAENRDGELKVTGSRFVLAAGAVNSAALLLASADDKHPRGLANSSDQVGRNFMMHNNAHLVAVDLNRHNDVTFQKTLAVNDWYLDGGDGYPLGAMQLIGKVQGIMMKAAAPRSVPLPQAKRLLRAAGYDAVFTQRFDISMNSHQCGTVVAGTDPATSVLDPWCKTHDVENLWVVDGGFFPSAAAMNPALTIAAQALRVVAESDLVAA
jgi:choline dehydrogenase-like flavoprotein